MINQIKTVLLLGILTAVLLFIGSFFGKAGLTIAFVFVLLMNFFSYFYSDKIVLKMYRAKEVSRHESPKLYEIVKKITEKAKIPMPKLYIIPSNSPNAFATGRNPEHAAVAATQGILDLLNEEELEGVMAHEISHVKNHDILISTIAATIAGVISYLAIMARWGAIFGGFGRNRDSGNILELLILAILAPLLATIIRLAISRSREYMADESAAKLLKNSKGLSSALGKLHNNIQHNPLKIGNEATSHLFIMNPFKSKSLLSLFSTHPDVMKRIKKLEALSF